MLLDNTFQDRVMMSAKSESGNSLESLPKTLMFVDAKGNSVFTNLCSVVPNLRVCIAVMPFSSDTKRRQPNKRKELIAGLPNDIVDLLGSFVAGIEEVGQIRTQLPTTTAADGAHREATAITDLVNQTKRTKDSTSKLYSKSEHALYQAHLCFAATTDTGRMLFDIHHAVSPEMLHTFTAYQSTRPPPVALFRRLKAVCDKVQRMKMLLSEATEQSTQANPSNKALQVSLSVDWTMVDISALLTDIDNQFELVQRMITFLKSEIDTIETVQAAQSGSGRQTLTQYESVESALDGLSLTEDIARQQSTDVAGDRDDDSFVLTDKLECDEGLEGQHPQSRTTSTYKHRQTTMWRREGSVWSTVRNAAKQTKRPNYSFEIYEQMMSADHSHQPGTERATLYRHYSSAYRSLKGSHRTRTSEDNDVQDAVHIAVSNYQRAEAAAVPVAEPAVAPGSRLGSKKPAPSSSFTHTPDAKSRPSSARFPFVTSPTWKLAANSPGDWRHIQLYADRSKSPEEGAKKMDTKQTSKATPASAFGDKNYVSPLIGILEHINKYPERLPKPPVVTAPAIPRPSTVFTSSASANAVVSSGSVDGGGGVGMAAFTPGMRRERNNKLVDSPDSSPRARSSSRDRDAETSLFLAKMSPLAVPASHSTRAAAGAGTGDSFGILFGSSLPTAISTDQSDESSRFGSENAKKKSSRTPTALSGTAASATSPGFGAHPGAGAGGAPQIPVIPTTVPEIAQRVREIYAAAAPPEKQTDVPKLLVKYAGKESELMEKVIKKYGNPPPPPGPPASNRSPSAAPLSPSIRKPSLSGQDSANSDRKGSFGNADSAPINIRKSSIGSSSDGAVAGSGLGGGFGGMGATSLFGQRNKTPTSAANGQTGGGLAGAVTPTSLFSPPKPGAAGTGGSGGGFGGIGGATTPTASLFPPGGGLFGKPSAEVAAAEGDRADAKCAGWLLSKPQLGVPKQPVPGSVEDVLRKVHAIYTQHNHVKISEIPQLMEKYKGKELQLLANLEKKYGPTPVAAPVEPSFLLSGAAAPSTDFGAGATTGIGGAGASAGGTSSLFGKPSTGFGQPTAATTTAPATSGFASPIAGGAGKTPSPFGTAATPAGATTSPFGASAAAVPSPFGNIGAASATPSGGIGSLFGGGRTSGASPGTGFGQATTGTGGLFGGNRGSAGVAGTASPFGNTAQASSSGTGGLFGGSTAVGGGTSPFSSGYSTPLGKAAGTGGAGSLFQPQGGAPAPAMGGTGFGQQAGNTMLGGGTTSPSVFGNRSAAPTSSLFGGGSAMGNITNAASGQTGFGSGMGQTSSLFGGGHGAAQQTHGQGAGHTTAGLHSLQDVQQRVHAIYAQYNPSKLTEIPHLMEKYKGQELQLIANLEKKYNINSAKMGNTTAPSTGFGGFGNVNTGGANTSVFGQGHAAAAPSTGFGGGNTAGSGSSLFGRPSPSAAPNQAGGSLFGGGAAGGGGSGGGGLFGGTSAFGGAGMGATATPTPFSGMQSNAAGSGVAGASSMFGSTTRLGAGNTSTGFGGTTFGGGGGSLFGGGAANANNMWGNR